MYSPHKKLIVLLLEVALPQHLTPEFITAERVKGLMKCVRFGCFHRKHDIQVKWGDKTYLVCAPQ
jgi:hypothetical protein